ncbi:MAG: uracil-DNA glycosylase [Lentimicrobiaceae bacterium]|nr:uracil-DNA glycosylase [Lentimicrobiaceae bacterium]
MSNSTPQIEEGWMKVLMPEFEAPYFSMLKDFLVNEKKTYAVYPPGSQIFAAFNHTPFDKVKVVILGQDPYHGIGQAHGMCFSVNHGVPKPPSLINIFKELESDLGIPPARSGNLLKWAEEGVFLLNAILTVRANQPASHQGRGWEMFTDAAIRALSEHKKGIIFLLWGAYAQAKQALINTENHYVLKAAHPSPLAAAKGFFGCRHFSKTNEILTELHQKPIDWRL